MLSSQLFRFNAEAAIVKDIMGIPMDAHADVPASSAMDVEQTGPEVPPNERVSLGTKAAASISTYLRIWLLLKGNWKKVVALDIGCSTGEACAAACLLDDVLCVKGIDPGQWRVAFAQTEYRSLKFSIRAQKLLNKCLFYVGNAGDRQCWDGKRKGSAYIYPNLSDCDIILMFDKVFLDSDQDAIWNVLHDLKQPVRVASCYQPKSFFSKGNGYNCKQSPFCFRGQLPPLKGHILYAYSSFSQDWVSPMPRQSEMFVSWMR